MNDALPIIRIRGLAHFAALFDRHRLVREQRTMDAMIRLFCRAKHGRDEGLCAECAALRDYAAARLDRCRFGVAKPTCANCPIHCYVPRRREQVKEFMRFAGPRMLWRHPILAVFHLLDGWRQPEVHPRILDSQE